MNPQFVPYLGPVLSALIAASTAFLAAVLSKEFKVSEFRQAWIDSLRSDLATLYSTNTIIYEAMAVWMGEGKTQHEVLEFMLQFKGDIAEAEAAKARIQLRLNPLEHEKLIKAVRDMDFPSNGLFQSGIPCRNERELIEIGQVVLKAEWKRVKQGERIYRGTKAVAFTLLILATVSLVVMYLYLPGLA